MQDQLSQIDAPATPAPEVPLLTEIATALMQHLPSALAEGEQRERGVEEMADAVMGLLVERGHVLPGAPPAQQIMEDAKSFAMRLTLSNLALRILNMLAWSNVQTPESKEARRWLEDYLEGKNHGPVGRPMLWPGRLPGLASLLREWGFVPTIATPGAPSYVARAMPNPTPQ